RSAALDPLRQLSLFADQLADPGQLRTEGLVRRADLVEAVGDHAGQTRPMDWQPGGEVPLFEQRKKAQQGMGVDHVVARVSAHRFSLASGSSARPGAGALAQG